MSRRLEKAIRRERREAREAMAQLTFWQTLGRYEFEYNARGYTGFYRAVGGRLANGDWPIYYARTAHKGRTHGEHSRNSRPAGDAFSSRAAP